MSESVTIYDIAKACDVSIATVSRVLNHSPKVSVKTKEKILAKMKDLQYNPSPFARSMGLQSLRLIAIVCRTMALSPISDAVTQLTLTLQHHGYGALLCVGTEEEIRQALATTHVDAMISFYDPVPSALAKTIPSIVVEGGDDALPAYQIQSSLTVGIDEIIEKFAKQGLQRPLCLWDDRLYLKHLKNALNRHNVKVLSLSATADWTKLPACDSIIATTDTLAVMAATHLQRQNQSTPVVSLVESPLTAAMEITSLQTNFTSQCDMAVQHVLTLLSTAPTAVPIRTEFQAHWIYRSSFQ